VNQVRISVLSITANCTQPRRRYLRIGDSIPNSNVVPLVFFVGNQYRYGVSPLANNQAWDQRNEPASLRATHFDAMEGSPNSPAVTVRLNAQGVDLLLDFLH
jgi:hypothetical protein